MYIMKFVCPNKKIRFGHMIASVGHSQCVHANGIIVLNLVATTLGKIRSTFFHYFACSVNSALKYKSMFLKHVKKSLFT